MLQLHRQVFLSFLLIFRSKQREEEGGLSSLIHTNLKLQAEQHLLLLRNRELRNQAMLLAVENCRLKEQLQSMAPKQMPTATEADTDAAHMIASDDSPHEPSRSEVCEDQVKMM
jgi:hypothetical protein